MKLTVRELNPEELSKCEYPEVPCIAIIIVGDDNKEYLMDYMYLMRGYCFQIGGLNANGASFNSTVVGFGNVVNAMLAYAICNKPSSRSSIYASNVRIADRASEENSILREMLNGQATICILQAIQSYINNTKRYEYITDSLSVSIIDTQIGRAGKDYDGSTTVWSKFICDVEKDIMFQV